MKGAVIFVRSVGRCAYLWRPGWVDRRASALISSLANDAAAFHSYELNRLPETAGPS